MRVLVYGLGRSGVSAGKLLRSQGHEVIYFDEKVEMLPELDALGCERINSPLDTKRIDVCIAAPGVPYDHPDLVALRGREIETIGEVEWVYRTVNADIVGITGTAGKGTVTRWTSDALQAAGLDAPAGGNIDPALSEVAEEGKTLVAELSSFMLERTPTLKPRIAAALNLDVDHLDRHGSVAAYHEAKRNLIKNLDEGCTFIYNADDTKLHAWATEAEEKGASVLSFSITQLADAYLTDDTIFLDGEPLLPLQELQISGSHHYANALAVALICRAKGLTRDQIKDGLVAFVGIPGRYSLVKTLGDVRFIEDSVATRSLAVRAALEATPAPVVWLAGGQDKGADFTALEPLIRAKVALFVGIGASGRAFAEAVSDWTQTVVVEARDGQVAMDRAVQQASAFLQNDPEGGTVLLAPLAASFDQFKDYKARAQAFRNAVRALENNLGAPQNTLEEEVSWTRS